MLRKIGQSRSIMYVWNCFSLSMYLLGNQCFIVSLFSVTPPSRSLSSSLDSISALRGPTGISTKQNTERNSRTGGIGDESLGSGTSVGAGQTELPPPPGEVTVSLSSPTTSWKQDTADPKPNLNGGESVEEDDVKEDTQPTISCAVAASSSHNNMLLTQIATSTSAPRNKLVISLIFGKFIDIL